MTAQIESEKLNDSEKLVCPGCGRDFYTHLRRQVYCSYECSFSTGKIRSFCYFCKEQIRPRGENKTGEDFLAWMFERPTKAEEGEFLLKHQKCKRDAVEEWHIPPICFCSKCARNRENLGIALSSYKNLNSREPRPARDVSYMKYREEVYERDNYICQLCGYPVDPSARPMDDAYPHLDHGDAVSNGGQNDIDNLFTSHRFCNITKGRDSGAWSFRLSLEDLEGRFGHIQPRDQQL